MTQKADFGAEEWSLLLEGPPLAAMRVPAAERGGAISETVAIGRVYGDARKRQSPLQGHSGLIAEIVADPPYVDKSRFGSPDAVHADEIRDGTLECRREAVALRERKADREELEDYRTFVLGLGQVVAEAHKEGGFLGIGGKPVSIGEQAALDEIATALGATSAESGA